MQRAERCCKTKFAVDIMAYQYNYNHFEPYYYPWMAVAAPGLGTQVDRPSTLHTGADGNEPSCSTKTSHYTVALKIFSPLNKREYQQHSLRNIDPKVISTPQELKEEISLQIGEAVPRFQEFPIGFYQETKKMWIQNKEDLRDAWELLDRNKTLTLWCHGQDSRKKKRSAIDLSSEHDAVSNSDSDAGEATGSKRRKTSGGLTNSRTTSEGKATRVQEIKDELEKKHGSKYNGCQYRLWAEMVFAGVHTDKEEPPQVPMFGNQRKHTRTTSNSGADLSDALTGVAIAIKNAFSPDSQRDLSKHAFSPSKAVDMRSKYIQQLKDLMSLHEMGGLTTEEYEEERCIIVRQMRKLQRDE